MFLNRSLFFFQVPNKPRYSRDDLSSTLALFQQLTCSCSQQQGVAVLQSRVATHLDPQPSDSDAYCIPMHPPEESPTLPTRSPAAPSGQAAPPTQAAAPPGVSAWSGAPRGRPPHAGVPGRLYAPNLRTLRRPAPGRHLDHRLPYRPQPAAHGWGTGSGPPVQLPPRLLSPPLLAVAARAGVGRSHRAALDADRHRGRGWRRYRSRTQRPEGLWQRLPPRSGAFDPCLHRLSLGAQVGRAGDPGALPVRHAAVGLACTGGPVSLRGVEPTARPAAQNAALLAAAVAGGLAALVPPAALPAQRRRQLCDARVGLVRPPASAASGDGQQVLPRRQPVCAGSRGGRQEAYGPATRQ